MEVENKEYSSKMNVRFISSKKWTLLKSYVPELLSPVNNYLFKPALKIFYDTNFAGIS
jgi:hypothetical protein